MSGLKVNETSDWLSTSRCTHHFAKNLKLRIFMKIKKLKKNNIFISCVEWKMNLVIYAKGGHFFFFFFTRLFYLNEKKKHQNCRFSKQKSSLMKSSTGDSLQCNALLSTISTIYDVCFHLVRDATVSECCVLPLSVHPPLNSNENPIKKSVPNGISQ